MSVAFDTGGADAVRPWIRPGGSIEIPQPFRDIMGWSAAEYGAASAPTYPCLIDTGHVVAELFGMSNVPMAVWIDEAGRIVRPAEPAGATDGFRSMDRTTYRLPERAAAEGRDARKRYVDAVRDWVANGEGSRYALPPDEVDARIEEPSENDVLAAAHFRLGRFLYERGHAAQAQRQFDEARRLCPASWHYVRQALDLEERGKASGPDFYAAVDALGSSPYYPPLQL